ncbi:MAG: sodium:proton antiporter NhaD [Fibrobacterota bacterium]
MLTIIAIVFVLAYAAIALEHPLKIGKSGTALFAGGLLWALWAFAAPATEGVVAQLTEHLSGIAAILLFLLGAMSIVEYMNTHDSFSIITDNIKTKRKLPLLWIIAWVTFFLSSMLDNLTTTILMISLTRKLVEEREDRMFFAGIIVIAANAGGAWTPIGDATTTMLWIGGQVTSWPIMKTVFLPSILNLAVPLLCISPFLKGSVQAPDGKEEVHGVTKTESVLMLLLGLGTLVGVPVFKAITHLPPYMGILMGLGLMWILGEMLHRSKDADERARLSLTAVLPRVDLNSIFFFAGILLAVASLQATGQLGALAVWLGETLGSQSLVVIAIGLVSAIVDNIPLVAASQGMYSLAAHPTDSPLWSFLAYCAGTGGSILIIGSASGVAAMGLEKIDFFWYVKKITPWAFLGYFAGVGAFLLF